MKTTNVLFAVISTCAFLAGLSHNNEHPKSLLVPVYLLKDKDQREFIGTVAIAETPEGLSFAPQLKNLKAGVHGFHIHEKPSCEDHGNAAGPHFDPQKTKTHLGPLKNGHLGDLPRLTVEASGRIAPVIAPRLKKISEIVGHALMIHEGGDNYTDHPENGGGGGRMACGVIKFGK